MNVDPQQAKAIFLEAVENYEPRQRPRYLDGASTGRPEVRRPVEFLLQAHVQAATAAEQAGSDNSPAHDAGAPAEEPGTLIGPYKLLQQIGEGGMGTVWMAQQTE